MSLLLHQREWLSVDTAPDNGLYDNRNQAINIFVSNTSIMSYTTSDRLYC